MYNEQPAFDLLQEAVGKTFRAAIKELGCPTLPNGLLTEEHHAFISSKIKKLPASIENVDRQIVTQALKGRVLRVGHSADGRSLFFVRFPLDKSDCIVTFAYATEQWELYAIDSVQSRGHNLNRLLIGAVFGSAITAAVTFFLWGIDGNLIEQAKEQGYVVMTQEKFDEQIALATQSGQAAPTTAKPAAGTDKPSTTKPATGQTKTGKSGEEVVFTLEQGMNTSHLTAFLKQEGLIDNPEAFGVRMTQLGLDVKLQAKSYKFRRGMTEQEVLTALGG